MYNSCLSLVAAMDSTAVNLTTSLCHGLYIKVIVKTVKNKTVHTFTVPYKVTSDVLRLLILLLAAESAVVPHFGKLYSLYIFLRLVFSPNLYI